MGQKIKQVCLDCSQEFEALQFGEFTRKYCPPCSKFRTERFEERQRLAQLQAEAALQRDMVRMAAMPPKWQNVTFENSDPKRHNNYLSAFNFAKQYAENFTTNSHSLMIYSPQPGTGKTHLLACIANHILHVKKQGVLFQKARDLLLDIKRTYSSREDTEADILDRVLSVPLLVLDDVGVGSFSDWVEEHYWTVFDRRLEYQLPVVMSTNKPLEAIGRGENLADRIGIRAASRVTGLCQGYVIDMSGVDLR
jgi:DNA replication protein DnaC